MRTNTRNKSLLLASSALLALALTGCNSTPPVTSGIGAESLPPKEQLQPYLKVDNADLSDKLAISDVLNRKSQGFLEVNVELSSQYKKSLKLQYQFNWFDAQGFVIEPEKSNWQPIVLHGHQSIKLHGVAPTADAQTFNIYVREIPAKAYKFD